MHAARFHGLAQAEGPFSSAYFDDTHDTEDAWTQVELRWRAVSDELTEAGSPESVIAEMQKAVVGRRPPVGPSGRAIIANEQGVVLDERLVGPPSAQVARSSQLPYILPLIDSGTDTARYLVAAVDHAGADLTVVDSGRTVHTETVEGDGRPVHTASGANTTDPGEAQNRADEKARQNVREVTERVTALVDQDDIAVVFLVGETSSRSDFAAEVHDRVSEKLVPLAVGARGSGIDEQALQEAIDDQFAQRREAALADTLERFEAESGRGSGKAVAGLTEVCGALREGAVETLIVGDVRDQTVVDGGDLTTVAPTPENLSELGIGPVRTLRADEALPMAAVAIDASIVRADEDTEVKDGIAAVLRYAPRQPADSPTT